MTVTESARRRTTAAASSGSASSSCSCSAATAPAGSTSPTSWRARAKATIADANRDGVTVECANPIARGFPFRLGLYCDRVAYANAAEARRPDRREPPLGRADLRSDALRRRTRRPGDGRHAADGSLKIDWEKLRASVRWASRCRNASRSKAAALTATTATGAPLATIGAFEAHMRPNGQDLDLAEQLRRAGARPGAGRGTHAAGVLRRVRPDDQRTASTCGGFRRRRPARPVRHDPHAGAVGRRDKSGLTVSGTFSVGEDGLARRRPEGDGPRPQGLVGSAGRSLPREAPRHSQRVVRRWPSWATTRRCR